MPTKFVFTDKPPRDVLPDGTSIVETWEFGDRWAAEVEVDEDAFQSLTAHDGVLEEADDDDIEVTPSVAPSVDFTDSTDSATATPAEQPDTSRENPRTLGTDPHNEFASLSTPVTEREYHGLHDAFRTGETNYHGAGEVWAVVDSGIDRDHPVFGAATIESGVNFTDASGTGDKTGHGTGVAGLLATLAPEITLIPVRVFGEGPSSSLRVLLNAYQWLHQNKDRLDGVNLSLGTNRSVTTIDAIHASLVRDGALLDTVAAGNSSSRGGSPATAAGAFSVGACNIRGLLAAFSDYNQGTNPEVVGVGVGLQLARAEGTSMGTPLDADHTVASGTSFAAPLVGGYLARQACRFPNATPDDITAAATTTARDIQGTNRDRHGIYQDTGVMHTIRPADPFENPPRVDVDYESFPSEQSAVSQEEITELAFEDLVEAFLDDHYGERNVLRQFRFDTMRRPDLVVTTPLVDHTLELENDWESVVEGVGQTLLYANHPPEDYGHERYQPGVIVPEGEVEHPEVDYLRNEVPIWEFPLPEGYEGNVADDDRE